MKDLQEEYFEVKQFQFKQNDSSKLNSRRLTHIKKFCKKVEEIIIDINLIDIMNRYYNLQASNKILEYLNKQISNILRVVRRYAEGPTR